MNYETIKNLNDARNLKVKKLQEVNLLFVHAEECSILLLLEKEISDVPPHVIAKASKVPLLDAFVRITNGQFLIQL